MGEKVKVSKDVAEAIEEINATMNDCGVPLFKVAWEFYNHDGVDKKFTVISEFVNGDTDQFIKLMLSEIVVEQTPEEKILAEYNWRKPLNCGVEGGIYREGIEFVLNAYNIQIKGVNA